MGYNDPVVMQKKLGISLSEAVKVLEVTKNLPDNKVGFAASLVKSYKKSGLSPSQEFWVFKLAEMALGLAPEKPEPEKVSSSFAGLYALFTTAKKKLKFPKINLLVEGYPVVLSLAGSKSKVPNVVNVTDGEPFGYNKWYGRVYEDGKWEKGFKEYDEADKVRALLRELGKAPAETAIKYGKLTGRCCFCNKTLTDEHSTAVGFGKTCAENFGLLAEWKTSSGALAAIAEGKVKTIPMLDPGMVKAAESELKKIHNLSAAFAKAEDEKLMAKFELNPEKDDAEFLPVVKDMAKLLKPTNPEFPLVVAAAKKAGLIPESAEVLEVKGVNLAECPVCEAEEGKAVKAKEKKPKPGDTMKVLF